MEPQVSFFLDIKANYLVSPQLVVAFAIAGRIDIDFEKEPLGISSTTNTPVFLRDVWPTKQDVLTLEHRFVVPAIFRQVPTRLAYGTKEWSKIKLPESTTGKEFMTIDGRGSREAFKIRTKETETKDKKMKPFKRQKVE